jgi:hypothetical protein
MGKGVNLSELVDDLQKKATDVNDGDLSTLEAMLVGQATALQTMFTHLAKRASSQEYLSQYQIFMTLALKAQAQSRATISALVDLKYPNQGATFVKQANFSGAHQQVNNGIPAPSAHAKKTSFEQSKLLGAGNGETIKRMDTRAKAQTGQGDSSMATVV